MGCDIHIITQIKNGDSWEYVPEIPQSFDKRSYTLFAFLADVRNDFQMKGFQPKGLPEDMKDFEFRFVSQEQEILNSFNAPEKKMVRLPDGSIIDFYDKRLSEFYPSYEEVKKFDNFRYDSETKQYSVQNPAILSGEVIYMKYKDLMSYQEYVDEYYKNDWNEQMQQYGYFAIDFECSDYHSHSWLTLKELIDSDKTDYFSNAVKVPALFYKEFIKRGGVLPDGMSVIAGDERIPSNIIDTIRYSFCPDVIIRWMDGEDSESLLMKGISELIEISNKYNVDSSNIRIVFAFDN